MRASVLASVSVLTKRRCDELVDDVNVHSDAETKCSIMLSQTLIPESAEDVAKQIMHSDLFPCVLLSERMHPSLASTCKKTNNPAPNENKIELTA